MLELYQSETCPYSSTVRETLSELGESFVAHNPRLPGDEGGDVTNEQTYDELTALGEDAIPLLVDHRRGETVQDTEEIVAYLEEHYD